MKEVDRLAATIAKIDEDVGMAPLGAYLRTPLNQVIINKSFAGKLHSEKKITGYYSLLITGLPLSEAKQLKYYVHFKEPEDNDANKVASKMKSPKFQLSYWV